MGLYTGKNVLITGAAGIIGTKLSERLAREGANLILIDIDEKKLESLVCRVRQENNIIAGAYAVDMTCEKKLNDVLREIENRFNSIDVLYSNAAGKTKDLKEFFKPYSEFGSEAWKEIMDVNLNSMFYMTRFVGENMIKNNNKGAMVMTSSIYGVLGVDDRIYKGSSYLNHEINTPAIYSTTKAGIIGLCKYLATYWGKHGIRVNAIAPGGVFSGQNKQFQDNYSARVPLGRMADVEEIIEPMIFLGSKMASYISGQVLVVDGGLSAW